MTQLCSGVFLSLPAPDPSEIPGRFGQSDGTVGAEPFPEEPADPCERSKEIECESFTFSALLCLGKDVLLLCWGVEMSLLMVKAEGKVAIKEISPALAQLLKNPPVIRLCSAFSSSCIPCRVKYCTDPQTRLNPRRTPCAFCLRMVPLCRGISVASPLHTG